MKEQSEGAKDAVVDTPHPDNMWKPLQIRAHPQSRVHDLKAIDEDVRLHVIGCQGILTMGMNHLKQTKKRPLHPLSREDVEIQRLLGVGSFANVSLVRVPKLDHLRQKEALKDCFPFLPNHPHPCRTWYALKCPNKLTNCKKTVKACRDLYSEAVLLTKLKHENIVQLHGVSHTFYEYSNNDCGSADSLGHRLPSNINLEDCFLVLQCMKQTLSGIFQKWKTKTTTTTTSNIHIPSVKERISSFALGIAKAMEYLHQKNIIYRDLKPQNVGIDYTGNIRLFDFGVSVQLKCPNNNINNNDNHRSSDDPMSSSVDGLTGSFRYMAPEVLLQRKSYMASDVYSFGILLWQLLTDGNQPFHDHQPSLTTYQDYRQAVGYLHHRPSDLSKPKDIIVPSVYRELVKESWHSDPNHRPTFSCIVQCLEQELRITTTTTTTTTTTNKTITPMQDGSSKKSSSVSLSSPRNWCYPTLFRRKSRSRVMQSI